MKDIAVVDSLTDLPNISKVIASDLQKAGISTVEELRRLGSKDAFVRIQLHSDSGACLNKLCALEGAIQGIRWHLLSDEVKADLKMFHRSL